MRHLPNILTILRMALVPVFLLVISSAAIAYNIYLALLIYCLAAITDWLDGFLARRMNVISNFGKIADPLADKMLVLSALAVLTWKSPFNLSEAIFVIILLREVFITTLREIYHARGIVMPADKLGKIKTVMQMSGIVIALFLWASQPEMADWLITAMNVWW